MNSICLDIFNIAKEEKMQRKILVDKFDQTKILRCFFQF